MNTRNLNPEWYLPVFHPLELLVMFPMDYLVMPMFGYIPTVVMLLKPPKSCWSYYHYCYIKGYPKLRVASTNVVKTIINHPWLGMVYTTYYIPLIYGDLGDDLLLFCPHYSFLCLHYSFNMFQPSLLLFSTTRAMCCFTPLEREGWKIER